MPEGDSTASSRAAAAVQALIMQLLSSTVDGSTGGVGGGSIHSSSENGAVSGVVTANAEHPLSPEELAALQKSADRCDLTQELNQEQESHVVAYVQPGHHHVLPEWMRRRCAALALVCSSSCGAAPAAWEATLQLLENQVHSSLTCRQPACLGWLLVLTV